MERGDSMRKYLDHINEEAKRIHKDPKKYKKEYEKSEHTAVKRQQKREAVKDGKKGKNKINPKKIACDKEAEALALVQKHKEDEEKFRAMRAKLRRFWCEELVVKYRRCFLNSTTVFTLNGLGAAAARLLRLRPWQLSVLRTKFYKITGGYDSMQRAQFFEHIGSRDIPFSQAVFKKLRCIDENRDNRIELSEFVLVCCVLCTMNSTDLLNLLFSTFDTTHSQAITTAEGKILVEVIQKMGGTHHSPETYDEILATFDQNKDGLLNIGEFAAVCERFPMMIYPVRRLQDQLVKKSFGLDKWSEIELAYEREANHPTDRAPLYKEFKSTHFHSRLQQLGLEFSANFDT